MKFASIVALVALPWACTPIHGGALTFQWRIHRADGTDRPCRAQPGEVVIDRVRVAIVPSAADGGGGRAPEYDCDTGDRGAIATDFDIAPGDYLLSVQPLAAGHALDASAGVRLPPPQQVPIADGEVTDAPLFVIIGGAPPP